VRFETSTRACELSLEVYAASSINAGVASLRRDCDLERDADVEALAALVRAAKNESHQKPMRSLALHGMGGGPRSIMRVRLASAALRSADWDRATGRPQRKRSLSEVVAGLASVDVLFPEGQRAFRMEGSCLVRPSIEDVVVRRVAELPAGEELVRLGAKPSDYVPWSAVLWYEIAHGAACR
jgi:hypothetical protein